MTRCSRLGQERLLSLIELASAAAEDPTRWKPFLLALSDALASSGAMFMHHDLVGAGGVAEFVRIDPDAVAAYNAHYHQFDPWAISSHSPLVSTRLGEFIHEEQLLPHANFRRLPYFHEFSSRYGTSRLLTSPVLRGSTAVAALSVFRAEADEPFR